VDAGADIEPGTVIGRLRKVRRRLRERCGRAPGSQYPALSATGRTRHIFLQESAVSGGHNLDPDTVPVSGDRLSRDDIEAEIARRATATKPAGVGVTVVPHVPCAGASADHMAQSLRTAPHVTALFEADFSAISRTAPRTGLPSRTRAPTSLSPSILLPHPLRQ